VRENFIFSGAGELHIEITVEKLSRKGVNVQLGKPMVLLREQMTKDGTPFTGGNENSSTFQVRVILTTDENPPERFGSVLSKDPGSASWIVDESSKNSQKWCDQWGKDAKSRNSHRES
jgi:translation elongation factor EF-G